MLDLKHDISFLTQEEEEEELLTRTLQQCHKLASHAAGPSHGFPQTVVLPHTSGWGRTL